MPTLSRIVLYVRDVEETVAFYEKHFGFKALRLAGDRIMITVDGVNAAAASAVVAGRGKDLTTSNGSREVTIAGRFEQGTRTLPWLLRELDHAGVDVRAADVRVPTLDDVFLSLTGRSLREESEVTS